MDISEDPRIYRPSISYRLAMPLTVGGIFFLFVLSQPSINFFTLAAEVVTLVFLFFLFDKLVTPSFRVYFLYSNKIVQRDPVNGDYELMKCDIAKYKVVSSKVTSIDLFKTGSNVRSMSIPKAYVDAHFRQWLGGIEMFDSRG